MRYTAWAFLVALPLAAQELKLPDSLNRLADKAVEVVDVTLDASLLQLASRFLSNQDADEAKVKKMVSGLKGVYVRSYQFEKAGEYQDSDVAPIREQLRGPGWSRIVGVRSRKSHDNADVFVKSEGGQITGLTVLVTDPKELTVVNIVGPIRPEELRELGGQFGIPKLDVGGGRKDGAKSTKEED